jgi:ribulose-phosphate 3-epimerase
MGIIAASILNADFSRLKDEIVSAEESGVDMFTLDIMDGNFVPNITFGSYVLSRVREITSLSIEAHLMVIKPENHIQSIADAGADIITFHIEATNKPNEIISMIRDRGLYAGIALNLETDIEKVVPFLSKIDLVTFLSVVVGFGGQKFNESTFERVKSLKNEINQHRYNVAILVDGGVKVENIKSICDVGADILTVGTGIYHSVDRKKTVSDLKLASSGIEDQNSRRNFAHLLIPTNNLENRSEEAIIRLKNLRKDLDIPQKSWNI